MGLHPFLFFVDLNNPDIFGCFLEIMVVISKRIISVSIFGNDCYKNSWFMLVILEKDVEFSKTIKN